MSDTHSDPATPLSTPAATPATTNTNASAVADHYDKKSAEIKSDLASRSASSIYYLRNFNNWIKSVLINEFVGKLRAANSSRNTRFSVLDLGCGKGGDIIKWKKAHCVSHVTFADISDQSLNICKERYADNRGGHPPFTANFIHLDATRDSLLDRYAAALADQDNSQVVVVQQHDLVSSQFVLHYSFESFEQADQYLKNVSDSLKPGGYFIGSTTSGAELVKRLRRANSNSFGNSLFNIKFESRDDQAADQVNKKSFDLFGVKYDFQLDNVVECPEYLVNFECLVAMAKRHGMSLVFKRSFADYFEENRANGEFKSLITVMQSLEPFYPSKLADGIREAERQEGKLAGEYEFIESKLNEEDSFMRAEVLRDTEAFATMSKSEWEAITLYLVFGFVKNEEAPVVTEKEREAEEEKSCLDNNGASEGDGITKEDAESNEAASFSSEQIEKQQNDVRSDENNATGEAEENQKEDDEEDEEDATTHQAKRKLDDLNNTTHSCGDDEDDEPLKKK